MNSQRRFRSPISLVGALLLSIACSAGACSGRPLEPQAARTGTRVHGPAPAIAPRAPSASADSASPAAQSAPVQLGRTPLGTAQLEPLPFTIEPALDNRSVVLLSKRSSERAGWVRILERATDEPGPPISLVDEDLAGVVSSEDGRISLLTSRAGDLCLVAFERGKDTPSSRACRPTRPSAMAAIDDKIALLELDLVDPMERAKALARTKSPSSKRPASSAIDRTAAPRGAKKPVGKSGTPAGKKRAGSSRRPARPTPRPEVEVHLRWASASEGIAAAASPTGLRFRPPLDGMALIDAVGRPGAIDVIHFAPGPKNAGTSPLGTARIVAASLGEDGRFTAGSSTTVAVGELEYGYLQGIREPRLIATGAGSILMTLGGRAGPCEVRRVSPPQKLALARSMPKTACAVDPSRLSDPTALTQAELRVFDRIAASGARRAPGQPDHDPGRVVWAGNRAYYQLAGELVSADRESGEARPEPTPFPAMRARIAWGAFATDGEGIAWAAGDLHRMDAVGWRRIERAAAPSDGVVGEAERAGDRRRVARIGASWWLARNDVTRLTPEPLVVPALRGRAHPDATTLVGGRERGLFLELLGEKLLVTALDPSGAIVASSATPAAGYRSPVRVGFDGCERKRGGAIVAGVSASDPAKVVAFALDAEGRPGQVHETSLPLAAGEGVVRLVALPSGGALLAGEARRHAVWLDDGGAELASSPWPEGDSGARCVDGQPARPVVPSPGPGRFVRVPELAAPGACIVGDPVWTEAGDLRWFGSTSVGLTALAEAGVARPELPAPAPAAAPREPTPEPARVEPAPVSGTSPCPADMVAIDGGRFCIDRFEGMLVDGDTGEALSPDFPSTPNLLDFTLQEWATGRQRVGDIHARAFPLPLIPERQRGRAIKALARSRYGVRPSGYVSGVVAEGACAAAEKRLCTLDEFVTACRGAADTLYPYGDSYEEGTCNVYRAAHPAALLHGNASIGHLDPRLNRARDGGEPLLRETGTTAACMSRWGADAVYDLVGNLDEWVDDPSGAFAGGFYARSTRAGCEAVVMAHPKTYLDYSTGVRCCRDPRAGAAATGSSAPRTWGHGAEERGEGERDGDHEKDVHP